MFEYLSRMKRVWSKDGFKEMVEIPCIWFDPLKMKLTQRHAALCTRLSAGYPPAFILLLYVFLQMHF